MLPGKTTSGFQVGEQRHHLETPRILTTVRVEQVALCHIASAEQHADILTKSLGRNPALSN